jgi:hypothetical protein
MLVSCQPSTKSKQPRAVVMLTRALLHLHFFGFQLTQMMRTENVTAKQILLLRMLCFADN